MLDNTKTETFSPEPDWNGIRDELVYLTEIGHLGWWGNWMGEPDQERVLRCFGSSAYRLLHGLTKGEDYGCLELTLGDASDWLRWVGGCYGDDSPGALMRELAADTDDVVRFLRERRTADLPWPDDLIEASRSSTARLYACCNNLDDYPEPDWDLIAQLARLDDDLNVDGMFGFDFGAGGFAAAYSVTILPLVGGAALGIANGTWLAPRDWFVAGKVRWMLELITDGGMDNDFSLRRRILSLKRGVSEFESCLRPKS